MAMPAEAKCFQLTEIPNQKLLKIEKNIYLYISGIGYDSSAAAAKILIKKGVDGLISWGIAGGINNSVQTGDIIIPETIQNNKEIYYTTSKWRRNITSHFHTTPYTVLSGKIICIEEILGSSAEKIELYNKTGAQAVDMESAAIAKIANEKKIEFISMRVILDDLNLNLPTLLTENIDGFGKINIREFIKSYKYSSFTFSEISSLVKKYVKAQRMLKEIYKEFKKESFFFINNF